MHDPSVLLWFQQGGVEADVMKAERSLAAWLAVDACEVGAIVFVAEGVKLLLHAALLPLWARCTARAIPLWVCQTLAESEGVDGLLMEHHEIGWEALGLYEIWLKAASFDRWIWR